MNSSEFYRVTFTAKYVLGSGLKAVTTNNFGFLNVFEVTKNLMLLRT